MANTKKTNETDVIEIPGIAKSEIIVRIQSDSPLIMHKWSEKAKREMLAKSTKKAVGGKEAKNPVAEFIDSMYWLEGEPSEKTEAGFEAAINNGARFGFPSTAVKAAAVSAAYRVGATKNKVSMQGAFLIPDEFIEIHGTPVMREDMVRIGNGVADIRYRGEFRDWWAEFRIIYNPIVVSKEQLVNAINLGGFACGIGEWRIEKGGSFGMYHCC